MVFGDNTAYYVHMYCKIYLYNLYTVVILIMSVTLDYTFNTKQNTFLNILNIRLKFTKWRVIYVKLTLYHNGGKKKNFPQSLLYYRETRE